MNEYKDEHENQELWEFREGKASPYPQFGSGEIQEESTKAPLILAVKNPDIIPNRLCVAQPTPQEISLEA